MENGKRVGAYVLRTFYRLIDAVPHTYSRYICEERIYDNLEEALRNASITESKGLVMPFDAYVFIPDDKGQD
jgi:hypothetical protein